MKNGVSFEKMEDGFGGIYLAYLAGGVYEEKGFRGISHLAEHIKCKKEKEFKKELNTLCIETNAITDDNYVIFFCRGLEENVAEFAENYLSCFDYEPTEQEFESEKLIIVQEIESMLNNYTLYLAYERGMLNYGSAGGFIEDIQAISYKDFMKFYRKMLGKPSAVVFVGGQKMIKAYIKNKNIPTWGGKRKSLLRRISSKPDTTLYKAWSSKSVMTAILFYEAQVASCPACLFLADLLSDGLYSPLYKKIREENNLVYYLDFNVHRCGNKNVFEFITETAKFEEVKKLFFEIIGDFEKYVSKEDYADYVKKMGSVIRQAQMKKNSLSFICNEYMSNKNNSLLHSFNPDKKEFSYENMKKICKMISKRESWKSMTHLKKEIVFSNKV